MSTPGTAAPGNGALELPPFSLDVQALDLGGDIKAVALELVETENREQGRGRDLVGGLSCPCGERIVRRGFFQPHREGKRVLQDARNPVARCGGALCRAAAAQSRAVAADL